MADPFVAEIRIFSFNFPPKGWAFCDGQLLPLSQNTALFSLLGTNYGGDGKSTFALPNLIDNVPIGSGQGPGLSDRFLGETGGATHITLLQSEIPFHNHNLQAVVTPANAKVPDATMALSRSAQGTAYNADGANLVQMNPQSLSMAGGSLPHNNMMPFLTLNYCIALQGIFPPRQ